MGERAIALFDEMAIALLNHRYTLMDADGGKVDRPKTVIDWEKYLG